MELAFLVAKWLVEGYGSDANATWIVDNRHLYVLPMVNPDGNIEDSRWNARFVNINRNFPVGWGHEGATAMPGPNYRGPYAASEPETRAVMGLLRKVGPVYAQSFHTGVVMALYPWGWKEEAPPDAELYAAICRELIFRPEDCGQVPALLYLASSNTIDFAYRETGAVSWTFEVSEEGFLVASLEEVKAKLPEAWHGILHALENVERYGGFVLLGDVEALGSAAAPTVRVPVRNDGLGAARGLRLVARVGDWEVALAAGLDLAPGEARVLEAALPALADGSPVSLRAAYRPTALRGPVDASVDLVAKLRAGALDLVPPGEAAVLLPAEAQQRGLPAAPLALLLAGLAAAALLRRR